MSRRSLQSRSARAIWPGGYPPLLQGPDPVLAPGNKKPPGISPPDGVLWGGKLLLLDRGLRGGEAGNGHAVRRAATRRSRPTLWQNFTRVGIAAVFAADAELDVQDGSLRPFSTAIFIELADAVWSIEANGFFLKISFSV